MGLRRCCRWAGPRSTVRTTRPLPCMTEGCLNPARWWIRRKTEWRTRHVCLDCRQELIFLDDWEVFDW